MKAPYNDPFFRAAASIFYFDEGYVFLDALADVGAPTPGMTLENLAQLETAYENLIKQFLDGAGIKDKIPSLNVDVLTTQDFKKEYFAINNQSFPEEEKDERRVFTKYFKLKEFGEKYVVDSFERADKKTVNFIKREITENKRYPYHDYLICPDLEHEFIKDLLARNIIDIFEENEKGNILLEIAYDGFINASKNKDSVSIDRHSQFLHTLIAYHEKPKNKAIEATSKKNKAISKIREHYHQLRQTEPTPAPASPRKSILPGFSMKRSSVKQSTENNQDKAPAPAPQIPHFK